MKKLGYALLVLAAILTIAQLAVYPFVLPESVASHFGSNGVADGWTTRSGMLTMMVVVQVLTAAILLAASRFARHAPDSMLNVPHKEYWLAETRREETFNYMEGLMTVITAVTALFLSSVFHCVYLANVDGTAKLSIWFAILFVSYMAFTLGAVVAMLLRFRKPTTEEAAATAT